MLALALGEDGTWERIPRLLTGHVASLDYIVQDWSNATGVEKGQLLKRWAHGLFPVANQPTGKARSVLRSFKRVGSKYVDRNGNWREHSDAKKEYLVWQNAAAKLLRKQSPGSRIPTAKRKKQGQVVICLLSSVFFLLVAA